MPRATIRLGCIGAVAVAAAVLAACGGGDGAEAPTETRESPVEVGIRAAAAHPGVDFVADFESDATSENGIPGAAPWQSVRGHDQRTQLTRDAGVVRSGDYSGRFLVRSGDQADPSPDSGERSNAIWYDSREDAGETHWVGFSLRLADDFESTPANDRNQRWTIAWQLHGADRPEPNPPGVTSLVGARPVLALSVGDEGYKLDISGGVLTGYDASGAVKTPGQELRDAGLSSGLNRGKWQDFIIGFHLAPDDTGWTEVWRRVEGETAFRTAVPRINAPNHYVYRPREGEPGRGQREEFAMPNYEVIGLYRNSVGRPDGEGVRVPEDRYTADADHTQELWYDNFVRGNSRAAVEGYLNEVIGPGA